MTAPLLEMRGIGKTFPGVRALERVDLRLEAGSVHALIGKNGAGKSTLMKVLSGIHAPDAGEILIDGRPVRFDGPAAAHAAGIAIVHQELSLVPGLTVAENILLGRWGTHGRLRIDWGALNRNAGAVLADLDPSIDPRATAGALSIAQQQLVEIAKALARNPRLLVLDEPTSALSERDADRLLEIVRGLAARGTGIVYISHRLAEIEAVSDHVTVLRDGMTVASSPRRDLDRRRIVALMLGEELSHTPQPRPPGDEIILSVRGLQRRGAVDDVSFDLHRGEILGIAGLVGAGRTELVRTIFGADPLDAGTITLFGRRIRRPTPQRMRRAGVAFLPEDRKRQALVLDHSVRANLVLTVLSRLTWGPLMSRRKENAVVAARIRELAIATAGGEVPVRTLSGGNQQKVVLGKWLSAEPRILILDEPTRGIDVQAKAQIFRILEDLAAKGLGIVFISSEIEEVMLVSHRILTMARGRIVAETAAHAADMSEIMLSATA